MEILAEYLTIIGNSYSGYWNYLVAEILNIGWKNYFYWLLGLSLVVWMLEIAFPWRKDQPPIRKDFWLDGFYMFFNFFLFSLIGYNAISNIGVAAFNNFLGQLGINNLVALEISSWSHFSQLLVMLPISCNGTFTVCCIEYPGCGNFTKCTILLKRWDLPPTCAFIGWRRLSIRLSNTFPWP